MTESTLALRLVRFMEMVVLPVAILTGVTYFQLEMDLNCMLAVVVIATWLVDQLGSFAMFYRGKPFGRGVERVFFPINLVASLVIWWALRADWISGTWHWRVFLVSALLAAVGLAMELDNILDTRMRYHPKIDWAHAFCFQKPKPTSTAPRDGPQEDTLMQEDVSSEESEALGMEVSTEDVTRDESEVENLADQTRNIDSETVTYRVCSFDELVSRIRAQEAAVEPERKAVPNVVRGSPMVALELAPEIELPAGRIDEIAEEISARLKPLEFGGGASEDVEVWAEVGETVAEAQEDNWPLVEAERLGPTESGLGADYVADLCLERANARKKAKRAICGLAVPLGMILGLTGARLGLGVLSPLVRVNVMIFVLVFAFLMFDAAVMIMIGYTAAKVMTNVDRWLIGVLVVLIVSGFPTWLMLRKHWIGDVVIAQIEFAMNPVDMVILISALGYVLLLWRGFRWNKRYNEASVRLEEARELLKVEDVNESKKPELKLEKTMSQVIFDTLSLKWIWNAGMDKAA